jgi:hypothetical protein
MSTKFSFIIILAVLFSCKKDQNKTESKHYFISAKLDGSIWKIDNDLYSLTVGSYVAVTYEFSDVKNRFCFSLH